MRKNIHAYVEKKRAQKKRRPLAGPNHRSVFFKKTEADPGPQSSIPPPVAFFSKANPVLAISYFLIQCVNTLGIHWKCKGNTKEIQRKYKGTTKEVQREYKGNTKEIQRKYKGNTKEVQRQYKGNTKEILRKSKGHTKGMQREYKGTTKARSSLEWIEKELF